MSFRVIALDLDGTLLNSAKQILPESITALQQATARGIKVVLATGRHHSAIHPIYQALSLETPAICCNGAYLYDYQQQTVLAGEPMSQAQANCVLDLIEEAKIDALLYADDSMFYQTPTRHVGRTQAWGAQFPPAQQPVFQQVSSLRLVINQAAQLWKFALTHTDTEKLHRLTAQLQQALEVVAEWSWVDQVDITRQGNSKGRRLSDWVTAQGLSMQQVIAFGDNYNDLSMLETVGLGVAMAEADAAIKERCGLITGSNNEPSIANVIHERVLANY
jgi:Cof subfamily protein (haloacid dehalogenase superfamily)